MKALKGNEYILMDRNLCIWYPFLIRKRKDQLARVLYDNEKEEVVTFSSSTSLPFAKDDLIYFALLFLSFKNNQYTLKFKNVNDFCKLAGIDLRRQSVKASFERLKKLNVEYKKWVVHKSHKRYNMFNLIDRIDMDEKLKAKQFVSSDMQIKIPTDVLCSSNKYRVKLKWKHLIKLSPSSRRFYILLSCFEKGIYNWDLRILMERLGFHAYGEMKPSVLLSKVEKALEELRSININYLVFYKKETKRIDIFVPYSAKRKMYT